MKGYIICGIQQIGIGVTNLGESWKWYRDKFGMDCRIFEEKAEANLMLQYTGNQPWERHAVLAMNLQGGGGFEVWQYTGREPVTKKDEILLGDLGILVCKMKVRNITEAYSFLQGKNVILLNEPEMDPTGCKTFFAKDPYGNMFQMSEATDWFMNENKISGGSCGAIIGVSDIDRARKLYSDILGYNDVVYDNADYFADFANLPGGKNKIRRVLLKSGESFKGPFSKILGQSMLELICSADKSGKKIYENRYWGDPGFIHLCFDIRGMDELKTWCQKLGFKFTVDSKQSYEGSSFDMGEAAGYFSYIEDPDGTLIEFVETHKLPVLKKIGWNLDLRKRGSKPLPEWIIRMLRFSRVKT